LTAINALLELAKSPADCAAALLLPEFAEPLREITENAHSVPEDGGKHALARCLTVLRVQSQLREDLVRLSELSELSEIEPSEARMEFMKRIETLMQWYRYVPHFEGKEFGLNWTIV